MFLSNHLFIKIFSERERKFKIHERLEVQYNKYFLASKLVVVVTQNFLAKQTVTLYLFINFCKYSFDVWLGDTFPDKRSLATQISGLFLNCFLNLIRFQQH